MVSFLFDAPLNHENVKLTNGSVVDVLSPRGRVVLGDLRCVSTSETALDLTIGVRDASGTVYFRRKDKPLPPGEQVRMEGPLAISADESLQVQSSNPLGLVDVSVSYFVPLGRTP